MSNAEHLNSIQEATMALVSSLQELRASAPSGANESSNGDVFSFDNKDVILYALGGKNVIAVFIIGDDFV